MEEWVKTFIAIKSFVEERIFFGKYILNSIVALALLYSLLWLVVHCYELIMPIVLYGIDLSKGLIKLDLFVTQLIASGITTLILAFMFLWWARMVMRLAGVVQRQLGVMDQHNAIFDNIIKRLEKLEKTSPS